ncbi:hypothetical protein LIER_01769 [Lithospermum erythrorhizon]|uniref:Uncharacterized protein n=1 Tax=Lithospermum erythrorhizon TaxID=34254 RepID=A0AAV3NM82_LITER
MSHLMAPTTAAPIPSTSNFRLPPSVAVQVVHCSQRDSPVHVPQLHRRSVALGIAAVLLGLNGGERKVNAAARRPPPPPQGEKKDPNVSGVLAKVLASKKRKEAMKESMAKLKEKGKPIIE